MPSPRRLPTRLSLAACLLLASLATVRCGSSASPPTPTGDGNQTSVNGNTTTSTNTNTTNTNSTTTGSVTLQVSITTFAFDTAAGTLDANFLSLGFNDPAKAFAGTGAPYDTNNVSATACQTTGGLLSCQFSIADFDVSSLTTGLMLLTGDNRPSATTPIWRSTYTLIPQASIAAAKATAGGTLSVRAAAISDIGETAIATWSGAAPDYLTNGALLGVVQQSNASTAVSGATLMTGAHAYSVLYANDAATAPKTGSTGALGLVFAVSGSTAAQANTDWTLTATGGSTWTVPYTGTVPHAITVMYFVAN